MTMIEKVARAIAIYDNATDEDWRGNINVARAAIEAMHEPTEQMNCAGRDGEYPNHLRIWKAMINAALKED